MLLEDPNGQLEWIEDWGFCPKCGASWDAGLIPKMYIDRGHYGHSTHYSFLIGIEIQGVYDGVSVFQCPFCSQSWCRWCGKMLEEGEVHQPFHNSIMQQSV